MSLPDVSPHLTVRSPMYIPCIAQLEDDGLRHMIAKATATTASHPSRRWARPAERPLPATPDRPVTDRLDPDTIATLRAIATQAADRSHDLGLYDDADTYTNAVRALDDYEATR